MHVYRHAYNRVCQYHHTPYNHFTFYWYKPKLNESTVTYIHRRNTIVHHTVYKVKERVSLLVYCGIHWTLGPSYTNLFYSSCEACPRTIWDIQSYKSVVTSYHSKMAPPTLPILNSKRRTHTIKLDLLRSGSRSLKTVHRVLGALEDLELLVSCANVSPHLLSSFNSRMTAIVYHVQYNNVRHLRCPALPLTDWGGSEKYAE